MRELNDSDLEKLYKAHQAESHDAGLRAVYSAGFAAGADAAAPQLEDPVQAAAEAVEIAPEEEAILATVDSAEPTAPAELAAPSDEAPNEPVTEGDSVTTDAAQ